LIYCKEAILKEKALSVILTNVFVLLALLIPQSVVQAEPLIQENGPGIGDDECLSCHDVPGLTTMLPSGEEIYIAVEGEMHKTSIHGRLGYACVQCHVDIDAYPHREIPTQTAREYTIYQNESCARCHPGSAAANEAGAHQIFMEAGILEAAVCTDCHGSHDVDKMTPPRTNIPQTCERCHSQIYQEYAQSAHGAALIGEGNPDVPDCAVCHNNHEIIGPNSQGGFRLNSPLICADCHANEALMSKYGISTSVFDTYVSDFHGTTVTVFEQISPDQETNKPVCIDCHGVHNMKSASDPDSQVMQDNILRTCQKCHPDASENFQASWLGHYEPDLNKYPLIFFVDIFYKIIIPVTVGGMIAFVAIDAQFRIRKKFRKNKTEVKK
jgi:hypothetical protein